MTALKPSSALKATGIEARCAATGMRMTEQRRVIARVLAEAVDHPDVEELYRRCVAVDDKISISTVYRTVKLFEDAGIIERHDFRAAFHCRCGLIEHLLAAARNDDGPSVFRKLLSAAEADARSAACNPCDLFLATHADCLSLLSCVAASWGFGVTQSEKSDPVRWNDA